MGFAQRKMENEPLYTEAEYLAFERAAEERHEYLDGVIYAMAGEKAPHGNLSVNLVRLISAHLLDKPCQTFTKDMKVRSGPLPKWRQSTKGLYSYPDLVIACDPLKFLDDYQDVLINPTVIIEVLSSSTEAFDRQQKFLRYQQYLPSLVDYVLVAQDQSASEVFHRPAPNAPQWEYTAASGLKSQVHSPALKCRLRLAEVYYRVSFTTPSAKDRALNIKGYSASRTQPAAPKRRAVPAKKKK
jgi:Uma2 family endonuclease